MRVRILATCRKPELLPYTLLVFNSIRIGFPTAEILVTGNALDEDSYVAVLDAVNAVGGRLENGPATIHHKWIESLCQSETEPFVLVDTDIIFYGPVEDWKFDTALAGWRIPEWDDEFSKCITRPRLHTSLLFIDPVKVLNETSKYQSGITYSPFTPAANPFYPMVVPLNGRSYFYDTCSVLYNAVGGTEFTDQQLDSYFHFNFGTISDLVLPRLANPSGAQADRVDILNNPESGRGKWREQMEYYRERKPVLVSPGMPEKIINSADGLEAVRWNYALCCGNKEAMEFSDIAYKFFHSLDDLIDETYEDRPLMSAEQKIELFIMALGYYNHPFYLKNQQMLCATTLMITNMFADSVAWEKSSKKPRRMIANVLSTCGDDLYAMIAVICGGWKHARKIGPLIRERDFTRQHTPDCERA